MSPPAIGFVTNLGVGMGEFDCCSSIGCCGGGRTLTTPARAPAPPPPSTICSWCCTAVAADDVGGAVIGMKRLCLDPTVLGDCGGIHYDLPVDRGTDYPVPMRAIRTSLPLLLSVP